VRIFYFNNPMKAYTGMHTFYLQHKNIKTLKCLLGSNFRDNPGHLDINSNECVMYDSSCVFFLCVCVAIMKCLQVLL